ncbi:hypothetical protein NPIL_398491 [Nephila pilipes]|uniref:Uncharacterized protein n=1 Tax=Nephila pilipes TaxID=299642 RepID=A0A8X6MN50_NEPPI|nr:hypothetical protein NPIL_398491 [Nephila pilipes]
MIKTGGIKKTNVSYKIEFHFIRDKTAKKFKSHEEILLHLANHYLEFNIYRPIPQKNYDCKKKLEFDLRTASPNEYELSESSIARNFT